MRFLASPFSRLTKRVAIGLQTALVGSALAMSPAVVGAEQAEHAGQPHAMPVSNLNGWQEALIGQTKVEEAIEGRAGRSEKVELQHHRLMRQMQQDAEAQKTSGAFNNMSLMHQYMGQDGASFLLSSDWSVEPVAAAGGRCPSHAPVKTFDISMIEIEITLNQWLDFYPGYMYILTENIAKARAEEARNKKARDADEHAWDPGAVSNGLQGDLIQPLVLRANQGDCARLTIRNQMEFDAGSFHVNGGSTIVSATGKPATTTNPDSIVEPGKSVQIEWYIHPWTQEGVRQVRSWSNERELTVMGLFGAFVVEPRGSRYVDPLGTGDAPEIKSGWQVMIDNGSGPDFREHVLFYHEIGDEAFRPLNKKGDFLPQRDPLSDAYRPGARAINYRSEPFGINNMHMHHEYFGFEDESSAYSSYTHGDIPTTLPRAYLGDPVKWRLVHGGSEVFHSHHPHG